MLRYGGGGGLDSRLDPLVEPELGLLVDGCVGVSALCVCLVCVDQAGT